jgi:hypothetical protein
MIARRHSGGREVSDGVELTGGGGMVILSEGIK